MNRIDLKHLASHDEDFAKRSNSWKAGIREQRIKIARVLKQSPSLRAYPSASLPGAFTIGLDEAIRQTGLVEFGFSRIVSVHGGTGSRRRILAGAGTMKAGLTAALALFASPAFADVSFTTGLSVTGDTEVKVVKYDCDHHDPIVVQYLNAAPNFLALVPIEQDGATSTLIFVNVISASGAKYAAEQFQWWTKGNDATLQDTTEGLDAAPVLTCSEEVDTP